MHTEQNPEHYGDQIVMREETVYTPEDEAKFAKNTEDGIKAILEAAKNGDRICTGMIEEIIAERCIAVDFIESLAGHEWYRFPGEAKNDDLIASWRTMNSMFAILEDVLRGYFKRGEFECSTSSTQEHVRNIIKRGV